MKYEWFIGLRYLKAKRKQTFISIITVISIAGVMVGVMTLIIVLSVMNGFEKTLKEKIVGNQAHLVVLKAGQEAMAEYENVLRNVGEVKGVVSAAPFIFSMVMLSSAANVSHVALKGIDPDREGKVTELARNLKTGKLLDLKESQTGNVQGIFLGDGLAQHLSLSVGQTLQVVSPLGAISPAGITPKMKPFRVAGIFHSGMYEYDNSLAYVSLASAQEFFALDGQVTGVQVKTDDVYHVKEIGREIRRKLGFPFWTRDWMEMNRNLFSALRQQKKMMFIILVLIVLVAAINIISTLIMVVMEKNRDIAILKSMGAPPKRIMKIFLIEGLITGVVGTGLGAFLGLLAAFNLETITAMVENLFGFKLIAGDIYYIDRLPSQVNPLDVVLITGIAILISLLATVYPSWRASRLDPSEILRYE